MATLGMIVSRMRAAGESQEAIDAVRREYEKVNPPKSDFTPSALTEAQDFLQKNPVPSSQVVTGDEPGDYWGGFNNALFGSKGYFTKGAPVGRSALGVAKGALVDLPKSIAGAAKTAAGLASFGNPEAQIKAGTELYEGIKALPGHVAESFGRAGEDPEQWGRTMGQLAVQPIVGELGALGAIGAAGKLKLPAAKLVEGTGKLLAKAQPTSAVGDSPVSSRMFGLRTASRAAGAVGRKLQSTGEGMRIRAATATPTKGIPLKGETPGELTSEDLSKFAGGGQGRTRPRITKTGTPPVNRNLDPAFVPPDTRPYTPPPPRPPGLAQEPPVPAPVTPTATPGQFDIQNIDLAQPVGVGEAFPSSRNQPVPYESNPIQPSFDAPPGNFEVSPLSGEVIQSLDLTQPVGTPSRYQSRPYEPSSIIPADPTLGPSGYGGDFDLGPAPMTRIPLRGGRPAKSSRHRDMPFDTSTGPQMQPSPAAGGRLTGNRVPTTEERMASIIEELRQADAQAPRVELPPPPYSQGARVPPEQPRVDVRTSRTLKGTGEESPYSHLTLEQLEQILAERKAGGPGTIPPKPSAPATTPPKSAVTTDPRTMFTPEELELLKSPEAQAALEQMAARDAGVDITTGEILEPPSPPRRAGKKMNAPNLRERANKFASDVEGSKEIPGWAESVAEWLTRKKPMNPLRPEVPEGQVTNRKMFDLSAERGAENRLAAEAAGFADEVSPAGPEFSEDMLLTPEELRNPDIPEMVSPVENPFDPRMAPGGVVSEAPEVPMNEVRQNVANRSLDKLRNATPENVRFDQLRARLDELKAEAETNKYAPAQIKVIEDYLAKHNQLESPEVPIKKPSLFDRANKFAKGEEGSKAVPEWAERIAEPITAAIDKAKLPSHIYEAAMTPMRRIKSKVGRLIEENFNYLPDDEWRTTFAKTRGMELSMELRDQAKYANEQKFNYPEQDAASKQIGTYLNQLADQLDAIPATPEKLDTLISVRNMLIDAVETQEPPANIPGLPPRKPRSSILGDERGAVGPDINKTNPIKTVAQNSKKYQVTDPNGKRLGDITVDNAQVREMKTVAKFKDIPDERVASLIYKTKLKRILEAAGLEEGNVTITPVSMEAKRAEAIKPAAPTEKAEPTTTSRLTKGGETVAEKKTVPEPEETLSEPPAAPPEKKTFPSVEERRAKTAGKPKSEDMPPIPEAFAGTPAPGMKAASSKGYSASTTIETGKKNPLKVKVRGEDIEIDPEDAFRSGGNTYAVEQAAVNLEEIKAPDIEYKNLMPKAFQFKLGPGETFKDRLARILDAHKVGKRRLMEQTSPTEAEAVPAEKTPDFVKESERAARQARIDEFVESVIGPRGAEKPEPILRAKRLNKPAEPPPPVAEKRKIPKLRGPIPRGDKITLKKVNPYTVKAVEDAGFVNSGRFDENGNPIYVKRSKFSEKAKEAGKKFEN